MLRVLSLALALSVALFVGCSSTSTTTVADTPSGDDAGGSGDDDGGSSGNGDASEGGGRPTEDILVDVRDPASPPLSCAAFCATEKYTCATTCSLGEDAGVGAGDALYGDSFSGVTDVPIASCTDVPKASVSGGSGTQTLNNYECCCRSAKHQKIEGPLPAKTCNDVCAAHGLACDDFTIWDGADTTSYQGGAHASYDDGGATSFANTSCDAVPAATHKQATLVGYECGCF